MNINEYLNEPVEVGTVLKETDENGKTISYYLVGPYYVYCNCYDDPYIRPHKFIFDDTIGVANEDEKKEFIEALRNNDLIVKENYEVERAFKMYDSIYIDIDNDSNLTKKEIVEMLNSINYSEILPGINRIKFICY